MTKSSNTIKLNDNEITIMALHLGHGGIEKYISSLCSMLEEHYQINIIATYKLYDNPAYPFSNKVKITYLIEGGPNPEEFKKAIREKRIINIIKEGIKSLKILFLKKKKNIQAIKGIQSKYIITTRTFHNQLVGKYANKNIIKIATEHNYHNNDKKYYSKLINSIKNYQLFVLVSKTLLDFYKDKVKTKCIYIPNTIDSLPKEETKLDKDILISIGRLEKEKGYEDLIDIVKEIKNQKKKIKLYLIGDGSLKDKLKKKVKDAELEDTVIFTGYANRELIGKYMSQAKLYVMTSLTESFGIVLIEAMSYKVPCIAFDSADGAKELLKKDVGVLILNRDKEKMAKEIIQLLEDKKRLQEYSKNGYNKCQEFLNSNVKKEWFNILSTRSK